MKKKLTSQGPSGRESYTVTLPKEWIKQEKLDRKKVVDLNVVGRKIVISGEVLHKETVVIEGKKYSSSLVKVLQSLYRSGVSEIKLHVKNSDQVEDIMGILERKLIGYEVVDQRNDYVIIKDITSESMEEFHSVLRRIFLLIIELSTSEDEVKVKTISKNIKKLINYDQKILMKRGHLEFFKVPLYYLLLDRLEKIRDEYKEILLIGSGNNLKEVNLFFRKAYELFFQFDAKTYSLYEGRTYNYMRKLKGSKIKSVKDMHKYNLARIINSLYGDVFSIKY